MKLNAELIAALRGMAPSELQTLMGLHRPDIRLIRKLIEPELDETPPEEPGYLTILDTESTGTDPLTAGLLELGMLKVLYCRKTLRAHRIVGEFNELHDPGIPIPPEASAVNGITQDMVAGKKIDFEEAAAFADDCDFVIAHNAGYDRPLIERYHPLFKSKSWACTLRGIDWSSRGCAGSKLEYIAYWAQVYHEGHRAVSDCKALLHCLSHVSVSKVREDLDAPLQELLETARSPVYRLYATGAPFDKKDLLSSRGYRWDPVHQRAWWRELRSQTDFDAELAWMKESVFHNRSCSPVYAVMTAQTLYSGTPPETRRALL